MYSVDLFSVSDLFDLPLVNLDYKTENFAFNYYLYYFLNFPQDNYIIKKQESIAYILGKHEGKDLNFHGHVSALSIAPEHRRSGLGKLLMNMYEYSSNLRNSYFVDLFVRESNEPAVNFYKSIGYSVYRNIENYYNLPVEDAFDMRKTMKLDVEKKSLIFSEDSFNYDDEI
ncbi:N(alpha)-acetyltransferase 20 [Gurleya vavrai]